jgi:DNA-binding XRE family transcriptional regulator
MSAGYKLQMPFAYMLRTDISYDNKKANRGFRTKQGPGGSRMRLAEWRKQEGYNQQQLADALGVTQPTISYVERANDPQMPQPDLMRRIYALTRGAVTPNDFYDLPPIDQLELPDLAAADRRAAARRSAGGDQ